MAANADVVFRLGADVDEAIAAIRRAQGALADLGDPRKTPAPAAPPLGMFDAFAGEVKGSLAGVTGAFGQATQAGGTMGNVIAGAVGGVVAGAVTAGVTAIVTAVRGAGAAMAQFGRESVSAALEAEAAGTRLRMALNLSGAVEAVATQLEAMNSALQRTTTYSDEALSGMQALGLNLGVQARDMPAFTSAVTGLATALGVDLNTAATQLAQTLDGTVGRLGQRVPELQNLTAEQLKAGEAISIVSQRFAGFAENEATTTEGKLKQLANAWDEMKEGVGAAILATPQAQAALSGISDVMGSLSTAGGLAKVVVEDLSRAFENFGQKMPPPIRMALSLLDDLRMRFGVLAEVEKTAAMMEAAIASKQGAGDSERQSRAESMQRYQDSMARGDARLEQVRKMREAEESAAQSAISKAQQQAESEEKARQAVITHREAIEEQAFSVQHAVEDIGRMGLSVDDTRLAFEKLRNEAQGGIEEMIAGAASTKYQWDEAKQTIDIVAASLAELRVAQVESGASADLTDTMSVDTGTGAAMDEDARAAQAEMAAEMAAQDEATFQRKLAMIEQGYSVAEAEAVLTEELLRQSAANGNLAAAQELQIRAAERQGQAAMRQKANIAMVANAAMQTTMAFAQMAVTGELSAKKMAAVMLQQLSQIAQQKMVEQTALALGSYPDAGGMAHHFAAAAAWGLLAGAASGYASKMSGGASAGAGGSEDDGRGSSISGGTDNFARDVAEGQRMPAVTVQFTGNGIIAGTTPEAFAGAITPFIQDVVAESGGRQGSVRP